MSTLRVLDSKKLVSIVYLKYRLLILFINSLVFQLLFRALKNENLYKHCLFSYFLGSVLLFCALVFWLVVLAFTTSVIIVELSLFYVICLTCLLYEVLALA